MALRDDIRKYAPQWLWALDNPELAPILENANREQLNPAEMLAQIQETNWWKKTEPSVREYQQRIATDPSLDEQNRRETEAQIWDLSQKMGLNLNADAVREQALRAQQFGLSAEQITDSLVGKAREAGYQGTGGGGQIQTTMSSLKQQAAAYYVNIDDNTAFDWASKVASGEKAASDFAPIFKDWAKAKFSHDPAMVERIEAGFTPEQLFQPQKTAIAQLLEVDPSTVNMTDPKWNQVLDYADPSTGARRSMTVSETQRLARQSAEWKRTQNGQQAGAGLLGNITKMLQGR